MTDLRQDSKDRPIADHRPNCFGASIVNKADGLVYVFNSILIQNNGLDVFKKRFYSIMAHSKLG